MILTDGGLSALRLYLLHLHHHLAAYVYIYIYLASGEGSSIDIMYYPSKWFNSPRSPGAIEVRFAIVMCALVITAVTITVLAMVVVFVSMVKDAAIEELIDHNVGCWQ
jgi:hypothetical protein